MFLGRFHIAFCLALAGLPAAVTAQTGDVIVGVVTDEVNGRPLDSVSVTAGQFKALTDTLGVFSLTITGAVVHTAAAPEKQPDIRWLPANGEFTWDGYAGEVDVTVYSFQGKVIARGGSPGAVFSTAQLPQGFYTVVIEAGALRFVHTIGSLQGRGISSFALLSKKILAKAATARPYPLAFTRSNFESKNIVVPAGYDGSRLDVRLRSPYPLKSIFKLFLDPKIPAKGRQEGEPRQPDWTIPAAPVQHPGGGLERHDMLLFGKASRRLNLILGGKVVWKYDVWGSVYFNTIYSRPADVWMLSNGHVLFSGEDYVEEITPKKEIVWQYNVFPYQDKVYSIQPIGLDKVLIVQDGDTCARVKLYNKTTKTFELDKQVDSLTGGSYMGCQRFRATGKGTYIAASGYPKAVQLFDKDFNLLWTYHTPKYCYSAIALKSGNFLAQEPEDSTSIELNDKGEPVWTLKGSEIALPAGTHFPGAKSSERLSNGNTVLFDSGYDSTFIQAIEVTPEKQAVWMLQDWVNIGDVYSAQFLDEPGYPEIPGETNH